MVSALFLETAGNSRIRVNLYNFQFQSWMPFFVNFSRKFRDFQASQVNHSAEEFPVSRRRRWAALFELSLLFPVIIALQYI